jgi:long-chain acyl-CoA synthetase
MAGYRNDPEGTRAALKADGWLATGDLGFIDGSGFLWVTGRSKDLVVLGGGKKVHPDEVEEALARSPLFAEVCVLGAPARAGMATGFDEVWAVVVPAPNLAMNEDLRGAALAEVDRATRELARFKRPTRVALRSEPLPRTATGKIQKPLVREWLAARRSGEDGA